MEKFTDRQLLTFLANATKTYYGSLGHNKSERNEKRAKAYREELAKRGVPIPDLEKLLETGKFNGIGCA